VFEREYLCKNSKEMHYVNKCGFHGFLDVALFNILFFSVHFLWEGFMGLGHILGFKAKMLRDELPQNMTNWLLRGNHERFDHLKSLVYLL
jgi:hypothetical protein